MEDSREARRRKLEAEYVCMYFLFSHYNKQDFQNRYFVSGSRDFFMEYKKSFREKKTFSFHEMPLILPEMYSCTFADLCFRD